MEPELKDQPPGVDTLGKIETAGGRAGTFKPRVISNRAVDAFTQAAGAIGGAYTPMPETDGAVAYTHFDGPSSEDQSLVVLMTKEAMDLLPLQTLVRIKSLTDTGEVERTFLGVVVAGPFAEPDGFRADSPIVVATTVSGKIFLPRYHGRAHVHILGEESNGQLVPPRLRPRPNSPVFPLDSTETGRALRVTPEPPAKSNIRLGLVEGNPDVSVNISIANKGVLPRHVGILGTTGGGKSTTVSGFVHSLNRAGAATVLLDVEGEYTDMDAPTDDPRMVEALAQRGAVPEGTSELVVYHLVGRETSREGSRAAVRSFCLTFAELSPYAIMDILELNEAQRERFYAAYDVARDILRDLKVFPANKEDQDKLIELDEFDTGYPRLTVTHLIDVASAVVDRLTHDKSSGKKGKAAEGEPDDPDSPRKFLSPDFNSEQGRLSMRTRTATVRQPSVPSWLAVLGRLWSIHRLGVFDNPKARSLEYAQLVSPGRVSVIDLSDTDSPVLNNLVIAGVMRGVQRAQENAVAAAQKEKRRPTPTMVIIEEAHEFLSRDRVKQMPTVFEQVVRIAKRGRKRWLGLVFVTQLPQHLPDEVLGLLNGFIIHKISDSGVVDRLRRSISGPDKAQWGLLPSLAQGQAIVTFSSMTRPLLVSIDPTPCRLRLTD